MTVMCKLPITGALHMPLPTLQEMGSWLRTTERGHQALKGKLGTYVTPKTRTAWGYSPAHILFEDNDIPPEKQRWVRFMFQVHVDLNNKTGDKYDKKNKDNIQWV